MVYDYLTEWLNIILKSITITNIRVNLEDKTRVIIWIYNIEVDEKKMWNVNIIFSFEIITIMVLKKSNLYQLIE